MIYTSVDKSRNMEVVNINRGDDGVLTVPLEYEDHTPYEMTDEEYLIFGVREKPTEESELLLQIQSDPGTNKISFRHEDTAAMKVGEYSADVQLMTRDAQRVTVWPKLTGTMRTSAMNYKNFCIMREVVDA